MTPDEAAERSHVLVKEWENLQSTGSVSPIPHQFHGDGKQSHSLNTSSTHPVIGIIGKALVHGSRGLSVCPYVESGFNEGESKECSADVGDNSTQDDLLLPGGDDGIAELLVVPGIDLSVTADDSGVRGLSIDFSWERTIGT